MHCPDAFAEAGAEIVESALGFGWTALAGSSWEEAGPVDGNDSVVDTLTRMRHGQERAWGAGGLEVPIRQICRLPCFARFVCHVAGSLSRLHEVYNGGLATYRRLNGLRSQSHPMPDLGRVEDGEGRTLLEVPFWVWKAGDRERRPLYLMMDGCGTRLFDIVDGESKQIAVMRDQPCDWAVWHRLLTDLDQLGIRVRPRALMTTLFLRTFLADVFIHGIGGAKYDEVTDHLIREWLGLTREPEFLTVSGTLRLPVDVPDPSPQEATVIRRRLRELQYNADRFADAPDLIEQKKQLVAEQHTASEKFQKSGERDGRRNFERYRAIQSINDALAKRVSGLREALEMELTSVQRDLSRAELLRSREFPWVIYPEAMLRDWLLDSAREISRGDAAETRAAKTTAGDTRAAKTTAADTRAAKATADCG